MPAAPLWLIAREKGIPYAGVDGLVDLEEHILRVLREAQEPLYASEVTERLNAEACRTVFFAPEVARKLTEMSDVAQRLDGRWTLKRTST